MAAWLDELEYQVGALRGLRPLQPIHRVVLPQESLSQVEHEQLTEGTVLDRMGGAAFGLSLLGLTEAGADPAADYLRQLEEAPPRARYQPDNGTGQILIPEAGEMDLDASLAYIEAYLSALLDQHFGALLAPLDPPLDLLEPDDRLALRALVKGDIALLEQQWLRIYGEGLMRDSEGPYPSAICKSQHPSPSDYQESYVQFPCRYGLPFVQGLYLDGGWASVDAAYQAPPRSTEALMHPENTDERSPAQVDLSDLSAKEAGMRQVIQTTLGEWRLQRVLGRYLPERSTLLASQGWAGDSLRIYSDAPDAAGGFVMVILWDTRYDAEEHQQFLQEYLRSRFGPPVSVSEELGWRYRGMISLTRRSAERTVWLLAPDIETGFSWLETLGFSEPSS